MSSLDSFDPMAYPSDIASVTTAASSASSGSSAQSSLIVTAYNCYLPLPKREALAQREFEVQMQERENRLAELDKDKAKFLLPRKRVYTLPYYLDEAQLKLATERFPRTTFKVGLDHGHDHPLAHLETMIGSDQVARMFKAGRIVLDLFGSPKRCAELNRQQQRSNNPKQFVPVVSKETEKDYLRSLEWEGYPHQDITGQGGVDAVFDCREWLTPPEGAVKVDVMLIHTLYYLSDTQICTMLARPGARAIALIHRHRSVKGEMFGGETSYAKKDGMVEQINVDTGERYTHRDLSYLFDSRTKVVRQGARAYTWTVHKVTSETYIIELVACPVALDERHKTLASSLGDKEASHRMNDEALVPSPFPHPALERIPASRCTLVGGVPVVSLASGDIVVNVTCPELVEFLAKHVAGKPRDAIRLQDCYALAVQHLHDGTDFPGKLRFRVDSRDLAGHVLLGFLTGLSSELTVMRSLPLYRRFMKEHSAHLNFVGIDASPGDVPGVLHSGLVALKRFNAARKAGDALDGVMDAMDM